MLWNLKRKKKFLRKLHFNKYLITLWEKVIKSKQVKIRETIDFTGFLSMLMWVQVPLPALKSLDFTGFARLSLQKVIKKVIKYLSEGILIEKLNKIKGGNLVHMMLKRNSIRFEFNWHDDIKR